MLDTSVLIAAETNRFDLHGLFTKHAGDEFFIAAVTASELLHGVERGHPPSRNKERSAYVESRLAEVETIDIDLAVARRHAAI